MNQVRTCVGCRQRGIRQDLLRITFSKVKLSFDSGKSKPGRGCWVHPTSSCISAALNGQSISRALRVKVNSQVLDDLKEQAEKMLEI